MKKFKLQNFLFVAGILIMILGFGIVILWESIGREAYLYKDVIAVNTDISKGSVVTDSMLTVMKIEESKIITGAIKDKSEISGLAAKQFIPKNSQLNKSFFDKAGTVLNKDQYIFKVPNEWIVAVPSSIRRKDTAYFYEIDYRTLESVNGSLSNNGTAAGSTNSIGNTVISSDANNGLTTYNASAKSNLIDSIKDDNNRFIETVVAYVKDSANREVVTLSKDERYDGSSQVASIEIIVDADKIKVLESAIDRGNRFLILYNDK